MIAALQMYDWPEVQPRMDAFWGRIRAHLRTHGIDAPERLTRPGSLADAWTDPALLLGQTCGLPFVSGRCGDAILVARPDYGIEGASRGTYASALICRADDSANGVLDFRGRTAAVNEIGSQSGCNALADAVMDADSPAAESPFFGAVDLSGAHRQSANKVAMGEADIAAIDAVAWALHAECEPRHHARLRVLAWTRPMPALPFITRPAHANRIEALRNALAAACDAPPTVPQPQGMLGATDADYDPIRQMVSRLRGLRLAGDMLSL